MLFKTMPLALQRNGGAGIYTWAEGNNGIVYILKNQAEAATSYFMAAAGVVMVLKGACQITSLSAGPATVHAGELLLLPKDLYTMAEIPTGGPVGQYEGLQLFFDDELLNTYRRSTEGVGHIPLAAQDKPLTVSGDAMLEAYAAALVKAMQEVPNPPGNLLTLKLNELLHLLTARANGRDFLGMLYALSVPRRRSIRTFMEQHYNKPLRVEDYAVLTGRSLSVFLRDFKEMFRTTPKQWLMQARLSHAHILLATKDISVTQASHQVGYENTSHFIKAFKDKYGRSPRQFIKNLQLGKRV